MSPEARAARRLVFEIGTEELPPQAAWDGARQLRDAAEAELRSARIATGNVTAYSTPRRLVLIAEGVAARQADLVREVRGPAVKVAFTPDGRPSPAAEGFARAQGVGAGALERRATPQGEYVYAVRREPGAPTVAVLAELLPKLAGGLSFSKPMRWGTGTVRFARPVRWLVALFGRQVVACEFAGVRAGRKTRGHRSLHPRPISVPDAAAYDDALRGGSVLLDPSERRERIVKAARDEAAAVGGHPVLDEELLHETVQLVELPMVFAGRFADDFLELPREVLITVMQHHQKYFAIEDAHHTLMPAFLAVRNGDARGLEIVREGNEWVLRARLADARFFFEDDRKRTLADRVASLAGLVFLEKLGTMAEKTNRLAELARALGPRLGLDSAAVAILTRAAHLSKADLVTQMVRELPELQGIMGGIYARLDGEPEGVGDAIRDQYLPRGADLPRTAAGASLALLDKLDTLVGALSVGLVPTGSQDPYGLRRAANGIIAIVLAQNIRLSLAVMCRAALAAYGVTDAARQAHVETETLVFLRQRLRTVLIEEGISYDVVDAALEASASGPFAPAPIDPQDAVAAAARARALAAFRRRPEFAGLYAAFDRASRIVPKGFVGEPQAELIRVPAEQGLREAVHSIGHALGAIWQRGGASAASGEDADALSGRYEATLARLSGAAPAVDRFFTDVLVMDPDEAVRRNRLALLAEVVDLVRPYADLTRVVVGDAKPATSA